MFALLILTAAGSAAQAAQEPSDTEALRARVQALEDVVDQLLDHVTRLETAVPIGVTLTCDPPGRDHVTSAGGLGILVSCDGIEPILEGYRVIVRLTNPNAVDIGDVRAVLLHGDEATTGLAENPVAGYLTGDIPPGDSAEMVFLVPASLEDNPYLTLTRIEVGTTGSR
jgi:hypothetical protein